MRHQSPKPSATESTQTTSRREKCLALLTDAYGGHGGIAQYNRDFLAGLSSFNSIEAVEALIRVRPGEEEPVPNKVRQLPAIASRSVYSLKAAATVLRFRPTMIFNGHLYHSGLAVTVSSVTRARLVSQLHGTEIWGAVPRHHLASLSQSDLVLCVSKDTERRALKLVPQLSGRTHVVNNTFNRRFAPVDRRLARAKFAVSDEKVILTVARLDARGGYKGHDRILRILPELVRRFPDGLLYMIAGDGPDRPRLAQIVQALGVQSHVRFLGHVAGDQLPALYSAADVFAMPSTGEGFGIVYLEAMACGTPAIGLNAGGVPDAFASGTIDGCVESEAFEPTLIRFLEGRVPAGKALSSKVSSLFGTQSFNRNLLAALETHGIIHG